jgi:RNA polymerase sigma-70 factor (ECF subfamily)
MVELPTTRASLLIRLQDNLDADAWRQFVQIYGPVVYGYGRKRGLQDADAADLTQEVLRAVSESAIRLTFDPKRDSFRKWLFTVAHHKACDLLTKRRLAQGSGDTAVHEQLDQQPGQTEAGLWEHEYQQRVFTWAAEQVRGNVENSTWQAFWQTAIEGKSGKDVAAALGMPVAAVYLAKSRVMARLREKIQQLQGNDP